jgi:probable phosphoglycerate mutase
MILYLIRHGDPIYDPDSLTPLGHKQAEALANRMALYGLDEVYASSSTRAQMTAQPTCERLGKDMRILDWANEGRVWEYYSVKNRDGSSSWAFHSREYIKKFHSKNWYVFGEKWYDCHDFAETKLAEGVKFMNENADAFLSALGYVHDRENACYKAVNGNNRRIALFAHQGFGLAFLSSILDIPYPFMCTRFDLGHSSVTPIYFSDEKEEIVYPKALQLSNDSHLYKEDILTGYHNLIDV